MMLAGLCTAPCVSACCAPRAAVSSSLGTWLRGRGISLATVLAPQTAACCPTLGLCPAPLAPLLEQPPLPEPCLATVKRPPSRWGVWSVRYTGGRVYRSRDAQRPGAPALDRRRPCRLPLVPGRHLECRSKWPAVATLALPADHTGASAKESKAQQRWSRRRHTMTTGRATTARPSRSSSRCLQRANSSPGPTRKAGCCSWEGWPDGACATLHPSSRWLPPLGPVLELVPPTAAARRASGSIHAGRCWEALRSRWQLSSSERTPRRVLYACGVQELLA